jgi:hypothetical protein
MLKNIEVMKQKDIEAAEAKKVRNKQMIEQVEAFNKVALGKKAEAAQAERDADNAIAAHEQRKAEMEL